MTAHNNSSAASEGLKACPFCGPGQSMVDPWFDDVSKRWAIGCGRCGASSGRSVHAEGSKEAAIKSWNTRGLTGDVAQPIAWRRVRSDGAVTYWETAVPDGQPLFAAQPPAAPVEPGGIPPLSSAERNGPDETTKVLAAAVRQEEPTTHSGLLAQGMEGPHLSAESEPAAWQYFGGGEWHTFAKPTKEVLEFWTKPELEGGMGSKVRPLFTREPQTLGVREALEECVDTLALVEHPRAVDPLYGEEVRRLGDRIGYGALMSSASASWRAKLAGDGYPVGGEFVAGPCHGSVLIALKKARAALALSRPQSRSGE